MRLTRRALLKSCAGAVAAAAWNEGLLRAARAQAAVAASPGGAIVIDPTPRFDLSPHLYMQFMEPLGTTDSAVEAAWSYDLDDWRRDFVEATRDLAPGVIRYGGLFSRYYKWREGVGPAGKRPLMRNYSWGGKETNRVGTREFVELCRRVGAEPLYCVNFLSDGRKRYAALREGNRTGDAREAAEWVSYANDPDNRERKSHGVAAPHTIKLWQLGNETSYGADGFDKDQCIAHTIEFARAMRERDPSIQLIGWGDFGPDSTAEPWAGDLVDRAGEYLDYVAIHMMGQSPTRKDTVLNGLKYQSAPEQAWEELLDFLPRIEKKVAALEEVLDARKAKAGLAVTEGHPGLRPRNCNPILNEWLCGVYHARVMNLYERHGARVKIATNADFCGNRWTVNALMLQVPAGVSYLMPVGAVMRLFKRHNGRQGVAVKSAPSGLDLAASRTGDKFFLHAANLDYARSTEAAFAIEGMTVTGGRVLEIAPESPRQEVSENQPEAFKPQEKALARAEVFRWRFPARSVSAVELDCRSA